MDIEAITQKYYDNYHEQVDWDRAYIDSTYCEMLGDALSREINNQILQTKKKTVAPMRGMAKAKADALIQLSADILVLSLKFMLKEAEG